MYFLPELIRLCFGDTEGPGAAFGVAGVFPDGPDVFLKEAVGVSEGEGSERGVIENLPEGLWEEGGLVGLGSYFFFLCLLFLDGGYLNGTDICNLLQLVFIVFVCARRVCCGAIMPKDPLMSEREGPEGLEHIHAELSSFPSDGACRSCWGTGRGCSGGSGTINLERGGGRRGGHYGQ